MSVARHEDELNWPTGLLLAYYGDDFTGSTDAMEAMTAAGVPTLLFLEPPTPEGLARFPGVRCVGLAGSSRGRSPQWMDETLPGAFASLAALGAPILQYKVCSTFDSSPNVGSIGRAIDLGVKRMPGFWSPMIVGAPRLNRYQAFGNLFARVDGEAYRLDRHPTMSRHPVTPMGEADLRVHLRKQTDRRIDVMDLVQLRRPEATYNVRALESCNTPILMIDVVDEDTLAAAGKLVWEERGDGIFTASSSGLQYALAAHWRSKGFLPAVPSLPKVQPVPVIAAVSGSCSPVTARQIGWARANGFLVERIDVSRVLDERERPREIGRAVGVAVNALRSGKSVVVYSAEGPDDPSVLDFEATSQNAGLSRQEAARRVGSALAAVMAQMLDEVNVPRVVVAGGDSSGEVASVLGIVALSVAGGLVPGAPICRAWSENPQRDGLEIVLKGGQMGGDSLFGDAKEGLLRL